MGCHSFLQGGDHPYSGIKPASPASPALAGRFFTTEPPVKPLQNMTHTHTHTHTPPNVPDLIPGTWKYVTYHDKGELRLQVELKLVIC